jgi:hypothetical protein
MLYRVYTRSPRLNAAKQIHKSQSTYALKLKHGPRKSSRPPFVKERAEEKTVADKPYGEHYVVFRKSCLSNGWQ